ncbi:MAG: FKBP-type peptidyl-prolyl cis-trans isomerase [Bacteroides sp.]|nr:FKBP-type peptidyl-prolyl cis-trans isomerase [Bacteroides sp.]
MKKLIYILSVLLICCTLTSIVSSCGDDDNSYSSYAAWRNTNNTWYLEQKDLKNPDGTPYYTELNPDWLPNSGVLIHYFNDRRLTEANLSPMLTSTISVRYKGMFYNGEVFDSTAITSTSSVSTFSLDGLVTGWKVALCDMRVGDTCDIVLPYTMGYGTQGQSTISPYSSLKFGIKLVDIPDYEIR